MSRLFLPVILSLALAAPLGGCAKKGKLETPPDAVHYSYPAPAAK